MSIWNFIKNIRHNRKLYRSGRANKSVKFHTVIKATTLHEQIKHSVANGAKYTPPNESASGLHEFSRKIKK